MFFVFYFNSILPTSSRESLHINHKLSSPATGFATGCQCTVVIDHVASWGLGVQCRLQPGPTQNHHPGHALPVVPSGVTLVLLRARVPHCSSNRDSYLYQVMEIQSEPLKVHGGLAPMVACELHKATQSYSPLPARTSTCATPKRGS
jgi:hypothetical protein